MASVQFEWCTVSVSEMVALCTTRSQLLNSPLYRLTIAASSVSRGQTLLLPVVRKRPAEEKGLGVSLYRSCAGFLWRLLVDIVLLAKCW